LKTGAKRRRNTLDFFFFVFLFLFSFLQRPLFPLPFSALLLFFSSSIKMGEVQGKRLQIVTVLGRRV